MRDEQIEADMYAGERGQTAVKVPPHTATLSRNTQDYWVAFPLVNKRLLLNEYRTVIQERCMKWVLPFPKTL